MTNTTIALVFTTILNMLMILSQLAVLDLNPEGDPYIFNKNGTIIEHYENKGVLDTSDADIKENYPQVSIIEPSSGNPFTDVLSSVKAWFSNKLGLKYVKAIVSAPYNIIASLNLPAGFAITIGTAWYVWTFFIILAFFWGKE